MIIKERKINTQSLRRLRVPSVRLRWVALVLGVLVFIILGGGFIFRLGYYNYPDAREALRAAVRTNLNIIPNIIRGQMAAPKQIRIDLDHESSQRLAYLRKRALEKDSRIITREDSYVAARLTVEGKEVKAKIRLKGDALDHVEGEKWSLRVKLTNKQALFGMRRFSLQHPKRSSWINEWILHSWYAYEGLISLRYKYVNVIINGKNLGIYTLEESFDKEFIENNHRREGPILKFDESRIFDGSLDDLATVNSTTDLFFASKIDVFRSTMIRENPILHKQFIIAQNLLDDFRSGTLSVADVFDLKSAAKLYALTNLTDSQHALRWKNIRFYYNPIINKLETIGYNAYGPSLEVSSHNAVMSIGNYLFRPMVNEFHDLFFNDDEFMAEYIKQLRRMSKQEYVDSFFTSIESKLQENMSILHSEYSTYFYDRRHRYKSQDAIARFLSPNEPPRVRLGLVSSDSSRDRHFTIANNALVPIRLLSISVHGSSDIIQINDILPAKHTGKSLNYISIFHKSFDDIFISEVEAKGIELQYHILGLSNEIINHAIKPEEILVQHNLYRIASNLTEVQKTVGMFSDLSDNGILRIRKGHWRLKNQLIIPSGYVIKVEPGTHIDLSNSAMIVSYSPFQFEGTKQNPIQITSSDSSGRGFILIKGSSRSKLNHVHFIGLDHPQWKDWFVSGGVTFYESPVDISNCTFSDNQSEDALNVIRADFTISESVFSDILFDAFDGDFVTGKIYNSKFIKVGNDAIDLSGSKVEVQDIFISNVGDKAFSCGEKSHMNIDNCKVEFSEIAVASKDLSTVVVKDLKINRTNIAYTAYQKKPEFGPSQILVDTYTSNENIEQPFLLEVGSVIQVEGQVIEPNAKRVRSVLYGE